MVGKLRCWGGADTERTASASVLANQEPPASKGYKIDSVIVCVKRYQGSFPHLDMGLEGTTAEGKWSCAGLTLGAFSHSDIGFRVGHFSIGRHEETPVV